MAEVECGFAVCEYPDGSHTKSKTVCGSRDRVKVPMICPSNSKVVGLSHTHPSNDPRLSERDKQTARTHRIPVCTKTRTYKTKCYEVK